MATVVVKEKLKMYEALLCSPGMGDLVKVSFQLSRKDILILAKIIETGLSADASGSDSILSLITPDSRGVYQGVMEDILKRSGLNDFNEKLKQFA